MRRDLPPNLATELTYQAPLSPPHPLNFTGYAFFLSRALSPIRGEASHKTLRCMPAARAGQARSLFQEQSYPLGFPGLSTGLEGLRLPLLPSMDIPVSSIREAA